ncbi:MAG: hypothetical protein LC793_22970 [Thermomicrobia bacterium]|nr:hypothetical protein [Thermomicrobia bacterium]
MANLIAALLALPGLVLLVPPAFLIRSFATIPVGIVLLFTVLPCPAAIGVQSITRDMVSGEIVMLDVIRPALTAHWRKCLLLWSASIVGTVVLVSGVAFYGHAAATPRFPFHALGIPLTLIWVGMLVFWLSMHLYVFPLFLEQDVKSPLVVYRNAALMVVAKPFFTWSVVVVWLALMLVLAATGLTALVGLVIGAAIQQNAFRRVLPRFKVHGMTEGTAL